MDAIDDLRKEYELAFMLSVPEEEAELEKALLGAKAEIRSRRALAQVRLAYPIKKQNTAYFGAWKFVALPSAVQTLRGVLGTRPQVLRFLLVADVFERQVPAPVPVKSEVRENIETPKPAKTRARAKTQVLSNEALEEKLVEILK